MTRPASPLAAVLAWAHAAAARLGDLDSDDDTIAALAAQAAGWPRPSPGWPRS